MNRVKVKTLSSNSCKGFEGFSKQYPSHMPHNILAPQEFEQVINRINLLSKTRHSKSISIPLIIILLGIILMIIGFINISISIISTSFTFLIVGFVVMVIMVCLFRRKVKSNLQPALLEANNYFAERRISFKFVEKLGKPKIHKQSNGSDKVERKNKEYLEITFPAPGNNGGNGILGFVQNILPFGNNQQQQPSNYNSNPSFTYQPNQVNVNGVGFVPPPVNVAPQMNNGNLEFNLSAPSVHPNFNISIDAETAFKATTSIAKGAYDGYNTFV